MYICAVYRQKNIFEEKYKADIEMLRKSRIGTQSNDGVNVNDFK